MSRRRRNQMAALAPLIFGAQAAGFDPFDYFGARMVDWAWAPYEGPNTAPDNVSANKRTGSIAYGDTMPEISNYAGGDYHTEVVSTGVTLTDGGAGPDYFLAVGSSSYEQSTTPIQIGNNLSFVDVFGRNALTQGGYLYQHTTFSPSVLMRTSSPYNIDFFHNGDNAVKAVADTNLHVLIQHVDNANGKTDHRFDGEIIDTANNIADYGTQTTKREFSGYTGSTRVRAKRVGWFKIRDLTEEEAGLLEAWIAEQTGITLATGFSIASPQSYATYNQSSPEIGVVRGTGTYDTSLITNMDVSLDNINWTPCTLSAGTWTGEVSGAPGTHTLYVRGNSGTYGQQVSNVKIGRVVAGFGQSNMLGSSLNKTDYTNTLQLGIYDPRPAPMGLMAGRTDRDTWGPAYDEGWLPDYLNNRYVADGIEWGFVRFAIGSTKLEFWRPDAVVDAAGFGYSVQYYAEFIRAVIASQGYDPDTYDPATDRQCVEEVFIQIGETDARTGTTKASFKASLNLIVNQIKTDLGDDVIIRMSILQDLFATGYVSVEAQLTAIQDAVSEVIAENANLSAGPDFSGYVLDTDPPESNGNVHFYTDAQVDYCAGEWDNYPTTSQPIVDGSGNYVVDANGDYLYTETTP